MDNFLYSKTKFGSYLLSTGESAYAFKKRARVSIATIYKILHGEAIRKDVAKHIVRASKKELTMEDFGYVSKKTDP